MEGPPIEYCYWVESGKCDTDRYQKEWRWSGLA